MIRKLSAYSGCLLLLFGVACGDDAAPGTGNGGATTGGATGTGGGVTSGASSGGATTGGSASGGVTSGGATTTSGGATASGGASPGGASSGGAKGGATTGGAGSGAAAGSGGGANGGSAGKSGSGGVAGSGGSAGGSAGSSGAAPSSGCGKTTWPPGDGTTLQTIDVAGTARQYILALPANYDTNKPYRVIFAWHGRTGTAAQIAGGGTRGFYGLKSLLADSIFVAGQGLGTDADPADTGWPNTSGRDIAMVRALVTHLGTNYCVDQSRLMSTGFSYGGIMSNTIGCQMSDVFRAIAPIAGAYFGGRGSACNTHPIAYFGIHGMADNDVTYMNGETARELFRVTNHCMTTTQAVEPSGCVLYDGCDAGYPLYWCPHAGAHTIPSFSAAAIAAFFKQF